MSKSTNAGSSTASAVGQQAFPNTVVEINSAYIADGTSANGENVDVPSGQPGNSERVVPSTIEKAAYREYRRLCGDLRFCVNNVKSYLTEEQVGEEALPSIIEFEDLLEELFDCTWGEGEALQRVVTLIESQSRNIEWSVAIVSFLDNAMTFLSTRYLVDDETVRHCMRLVREHGLDPFRGTTSEPLVRRQYKIVESDAS